MLFQPVEIYILGEYNYLFSFLTFYLKLSVTQWPSSYLCFHLEALWVSVKWPGRKKNKILQIHILQLYVGFDFSIFLNILSPSSCCTGYRCRVPLQNSLALKNVLHVRIA